VCVCVCVCMCWCVLGVCVLVFIAESLGNEGSYYLILEISSWILMKLVSRGMRFMYEVLSLWGMRGKRFILVG